MRICRQRDKLENMLRELISERNKIADFMRWCIDHAEAADEVILSPVQCLTKNNDNTKLEISGNELIK